jgi:hypothetical protein
MTVVSSREFAVNQEKYFDAALKDRVIVQRGENMFIVQNFVPHKEVDIIFEPDDDFYKSIPMEEVRDRIVEYIHKKHAK